MDSKHPHPKTLFHLVPINQVAHNALVHPDNKVSRSRNRRLGLEVGYHVSSMRGGHVIARLGRNADLILRESSPGNPMSGVHVAFEINPATNLVILSVRSKRISSVTFAVLEPEKDGKDDIPGEEGTTQEKVPEGDAAGKEITGDGVILYEQDYTISIASYRFQLVWLDRSAESFKSLVVQGYQESLKLLQDMRSRDQPTEYDKSEVLSWHMTRLDTAKDSEFKEIRELREYLGEGNFGIVYEAVDQRSGHKFAIKVITLAKYARHAVDEARARIHREIKVMQRLKHTHIIEYLHHQNFDTLLPEIFMPLRDGTLTSLVEEGSITNYDELCMTVLKQMLSALDYLASEKLVHRDLKPDNILYYYVVPDKVDLHFQLADFGLAQHHSLAKTHCGTPEYEAPELYPEISKVKAPQSPKMDIWSLFATLVAVHGQFKTFPCGAATYGDVLMKLEAMAPVWDIEPMARLHPEQRASAAQMLATFFNGEGLTTRRSKIPPIEPKKDEKATQTDPEPAAGPSNPPQTKDDGKAPQTNPEPSTGPSNPPQDNGGNAHQTGPAPPAGPGNAPQMKDDGKAPQTNPEPSTGPSNPPQDNGGNAPQTSLAPSAGPGNAPQMKDNGKAPQTNPAPSAGPGNSPQMKDDGKAHQASLTPPVEPSNPPQTKDTGDKAPPQTSPAPSAGQSTAPKMKNHRGKAPPQRSTAPSAGQSNPPQMEDNGGKPPPQPRPALLSERLKLFEPMKDTGGNGGNLRTLLAGLRNPPQTNNNNNGGRQARQRRRAPPDSRLITYPPRTRSRAGPPPPPPPGRVPPVLANRNTPPPARQQPVRTQAGGVTKRRRDTAPRAAAAAPRPPPPPPPPEPEEPRDVEMMSCGSLPRVPGAYVE